MNTDKIKEKLNNMVIGMANAAIDTAYRVPKFWQLYLDANIVELGLDIVDTCATSQCLSVLAKSEYNDFDLINNAVASIIRLRNSQGSWPSAITVEELESPDRRRQGDTAIGDNCFALTALMDADFLSENFHYDLLLSDDLKSLYNRILFVSQSVNWLFENKAKDDLGWYYTDEKTDENQSAMLTTLNVLQVLSRIVYCLNNCCINNQLTTEQTQYCENYVHTIIAFIKQTVSIITDKSNIYDNIQNDWKAIGTSFKCTEPSIIHTCKLINVLLYNKEYNNLDLYADVNDFAHYIVDNATSLDKCQPFVFEYYNLHKFTHLGFPARTIQVDHENYVEAIILYTLINIRSSGVELQDDIIKEILNTLIGLMNPIVPNFCRCRSTRKESENLWHPVYASYEAYVAISHYIKEMEKPVLDYTYTIDIIDLAIKHVERWIEQNSSSKHTMVVPSTVLNELVDEYDNITTIVPEQEERIGKAKTFLRRLREKTIKIDDEKMDDFKKMINSLVENISKGTLGENNDKFIA